MEPTKPLPEGRKLKTVLFRSPIAQGTLASATVGDKGVESLVPAQLGPDGDWYACDKGQRPDGIGIRQKQHAPTGSYMRRRFVPFTNVDELTYSE